MNKKAFTEKDLLKWITIISGIALIYVMVTAITASLYL